MKIFISGLLTGLILQLGIGPVFFFIVNLTLQKTIYDGFAGALAVTLVDFLYITLAIFGVGKLLENKQIKKAFGIISSIVLILFGILMILIITKNGSSMNTNAVPTDIFGSFNTVFILTISSPMTIIFWTVLFAAKAVEKNYSKRKLLIFGLGTGLATFVFMGTSVILFSLIKNSVPILLIQILNITVGSMLILYGAIRFAKVICRA
jgi:threonine/homoserine/homoserine lactone efflux protein